MSISKRSFGLFGGKDVFAYTMTNKEGSSVTVLDYGGIIQSVKIPDRNGVFGDVVCGFDTVDDYVTERKSYFGAIIGRCGNRISGGGFNIGDLRVNVANNESPMTHLHGGNVGFNRKVWDAETREDENGDEIVLTLFSPDMEEGYPGNLNVKVTYSFSDDRILKIHYEARSDADTYLNMTNHAYYNMNGYDGNSVMGQELMINADYYDDVDGFLIPEKEPKKVEGTEFDFRVMRPIRRTYDHNFHLNGTAGEYRLACSAHDPESGRTMDVYTDLPSVQLYTAGGMNGKTAFKGSVPERPCHAFCLETQNPPDLPNRRNLAQRFLLKGEKYDTVTAMKFGTR